VLGSESEGMLAKALLFFEHYAHRDRQTETDRHQLNGLFSRITWAGQHQNGLKTNLDCNEARDDRVAVASAGPYANHLHLLQTGSHASTSSLNFTGQMPFLMPYQQCQSTEGKSST